MAKLVLMIVLLVASLRFLHVSCVDDFLLRIGNDTRDQILDVCEDRCYPNRVINYDQSCCNISANTLQGLLNEKTNPIDVYCKESNEIVLSLSDHVVSIKNMTFIIEYFQSAYSTWTYFNTFNETTQVIIRQLVPDTLYILRIWPVSYNGLLEKPVVTKKIRTRNVNMPPLPVSNIKLQKFTYYNNNYEAVVSWTPSPDKSCHHDFVWYGSDDISDYKLHEIEFPDNFTITMSKLLFNTNYSIAIMTRSSDWLMESDKMWLHFTTPHCYQVLKTLEYCEPHPVTNVHTYEKLVSSAKDVYVFNVSVIWIKPDMPPNYYIVRMNTFRDGNDTFKSLNVTGSQTSATFYNVTLNMHYHITIIAYSNAGGSSPTEYYKQLNYKDHTIVHKTHLGSNAFLSIVLPVMIVLCLVSAIVLGCKELNKRNQILKRQRYFEELELKSHYLEAPLPNDDIIERVDEWEIDVNCLTLQCVLGRGAFGVVRKGWLQTGNGKVPVAVKMLQEDHRFADIRDFKHEIEIMKSVGSHPNIVSLIGCYTQGKADDLRLVVEYCARGDLLSYLRSAWDFITNQCNNAQYANVSNFDNKLYWLRETSSDGEFWDMQIKDLISIGLQVAMGMEYLSNLHVLHRDLAARNVLVCEDRSIKVSDFGLSRDVYRDNIYCKTSSGKLPIRWLAIESLTHQVYTTQSDIWSYGILFWEIITLGGSPYPGVQTQELLDFLVKGNRMDKPINCSDELYSIMMSCWKANPKERPSFSKIRKLLENILENTTDYLNLNLSTSMNNITMDSTDLKLNFSNTSVSSERYVKSFAH